MNTKEQKAAIKAQQKAQDTLAEISLRNDCIRMSLEYYRGVQNKTAWSIDLNAVEGIDLGTKGKKITPKQIVDLWLKEGKFLYRTSDLLSRNPNYNPIEKMDSPQEITIEMVLKTASQFYNYIQHNKLNSKN